MNINTMIRKYLMEPHRRHDEEQFNTNCTERKNTSKSDTTESYEVIIRGNSRDESLFENEVRYDYYSDLVMFEGVTSIT